MDRLLETDGEEDGARVGIGLQSRLGRDPLLRKVAPPEVKGLLEVALGRVVVVDGEVGHRETVRNPRQSLYNAPNSLPMELVAELVDQLRCSGSIDLGKGEVELACHMGKVMMW